MKESSNTEKADIIAEVAISFGAWIVTTEATIQAWRIGVVGIALMRIGALSNAATNLGESMESKQIAQWVKSLKPCIAQHPRTGKWWAIDDVLRCPVGTECDSPGEAKRQWQGYMISAAGDMAGQRNLISQL